MGTRISEFDRLSLSGMGMVLRYIIVGALRGLGRGFGRRGRVILLLGGLLVACNQLPSPSESVQIGASRAGYDFVTTAEGWDTFSTAGEQSFVRWHDGTLEAASIPRIGYVRSLNHQRHNDLAARAHVVQTRGSDSSGVYGLICRASADGSGYYFLITSNRLFSIQKGSAGSAVLTPLVDWQGSDIIQANGETNELQAVCAGDYLALWVNGRFLADTHDPTYTAGELGIVLAADQATTWAQFDDITLHDVAYS